MIEVIWEIFALEGAVGAAALLVTEWRLGQWPFKPRVLSPSEAERKGRLATLRQRRKNVWKVAHRTALELDKKLAAEMEALRRPPQPPAPKATGGLKASAAELGKGIAGGALVAARALPFVPSPLPEATPEEKLEMLEAQEEWRYQHLLSGYETTLDTIGKVVPPRPNEEYADHRERLKWIRGRFQPGRIERDVASAVDAYAREVRDAERYGRKVPPMPFPNPAFNLNSLGVEPGSATRRSPARHRRRAARLPRTPEPRPTPSAPSENKTPHSDEVAAYPTDTPDTTPSPAG